jgi:heteromeric Ino2p/Ino4p transcription factor
MTATNNASRTTPTGGVDKPRLTDAEKKQNHIISEQKRRQAIRQGFDRLATITPKMSGMGRSEATVLAAATQEMKIQLAMKAAIKKKLFSENPDMSNEFFESLYEVTRGTRLPASASPTPIPALANSPSASVGRSSMGGHYQQPVSMGAQSVSIDGKSKGKSKQKAKDDN